MTAEVFMYKEMVSRCTPAKSGNLNLFLCILPFFHCKMHREKKGKKGKMRRKRLRLPDFAFKGRAAPVARQMPRVSHVKGSKGVMLQGGGGCSRYMCGCRATLCNYAWMSTPNACWLIKALDWQFAATCVAGHV